MVWVLSLGGSIVAPKGEERPVDLEFISEFHGLICKRIAMNERFILIIGGGRPARLYQNAYKQFYNHKIQEGAEVPKHVNGENFDNALDRIGIAATHLNAAFIREVFSHDAECDVVSNPEAEDIVFTKSVLIGAGWKPGFSTDLDAVMLAQRFGAKTILNISNIEQVYTADPAHDPTAQPLTSIRWDELIEIVGERWMPGMNVPFDPVACTRARSAGIEVISVGASISNLESVFNDKSYVGTRIW